METPVQKTAPSVLVVDDDENIRNLIGHLLKRAGVTVHFATNGEEAIHWLWKAETLPFLILLDLQMPVMDGWKFRTVQMADKRLAQIPVVVVTSVKTVEADMVSIKAAGFIKKPIEVNLLMNTVRSYFPQGDRKKAA